MTRITESTVEDAALAWFGELLATIRDELLPKLLSGEIRIKDAEKFVKGRL